MSGKMLSLSGDGGFRKKMECLERGLLSFSMTGTT